MVKQWRTNRDKKQQQIEHNARKNCTNSSLFDILSSCCCFFHNFFLVFLFFVFSLFIKRCLAISDINGKPNAQTYKNHEMKPTHARKTWKSFVIKILFHLFIYLLFCWCCCCCCYCFSWEFIHSYEHKSAFTHTHTCSHIDMHTQNEIHIKTSID